MASSKEFINDLLVHMNPMVHLAGNADSTFEMLLYLSEMDPTFHKLELVKYVRKRLRDGMLGDVEKHVNKYLEEHKTKIRMDNPTDSLVTEISSTKEFRDLKKSLNSELAATANMICDGHEIGYFEDLLEEVTLQEHISPVTSSETSLNSSLNQSGFLFMHPGQYNIICDNLNNKVDPDKVLEAINMLLCVTPGEPVSQDTWPVIKKHLLTLLQVDDDEVFLKTVKFHVRLLSSQCHNAVKDGFLNLLHAISAFWFTKRLINHLPRKNGPISIQENKLLVLIDIILQFLQELPMVWVRYPVKYTNEIIDEVLNCFCTCMNITPSHLALLDLVAVLDPKCLWFSSWMHGQWGRKRSIEFLEAKRSILSHCLSTCSTMLGKQKQELTTPMNNGIISGPLMFHLIFSHHLNFLLTLLRYAEGRKVFPLHQLHTASHLSTKRLINILLQNIQSTDVKVAATVLKNIKRNMLDDEFRCGMICESGALEPLALSLTSKRDPDYCQNVLKFFVTLSSTLCGYEYMLGGRSRKNSGEKIYETISKFSKTVQFDPKSHTTALCTMLLSGMLRSPLGNLLMYNESFLGNVQNFIRKHIKNNATHCMLNHDVSQIYLHHILHCHVWTLQLEVTGIIEPILEEILPEYMKTGSIDLQLINSISNSVSGCKILGRMSFISDLWDVMNSLKEEQLMPNSFEADSDIILLPLVCLAASINGLTLLLSNLAIKNEIMNVFDRTTTDKHILFLLNIAASNLSVSTILTDMNIQYKIINKLKESIHQETNSIIVDEETVALYQILLKLLLPKGISQKFIPSSFKEHHVKYIINHLPQSEDPVKGKPGKGEVYKLITESLHQETNSKWISEAKRAFRHDLKEPIYIDTPSLLTLLESSVEALRESREERIVALPPPGKSVVASSSSLSNEKFVEQPSEGGAHLDSNVFDPTSGNMVAADIMIRYGEDQGLITMQDYHKAHIMQMLLSLESHVYKTPPTMVDWFAHFWYIKAGGDFERVFNILQDLASTLTGLILWPCLYESYAAHSNVPRGLMRCHIVESTRFVLYTESHTTYLGLNHMSTNKHEELVENCTSTTLFL